MSYSQHDPLRDHRQVRGYYDHHPVYAMSARVTNDRTEGTHEEVSTREANGLMIPSNDSTVNFIGKLVNVLRKYTRL